MFAVGSGTWYVEGGAVVLDGRLLSCVKQVSGCEIIKSSAIYRVALLEEVGG